MGVGKWVDVVGWWQENDVKNFKSVNGLVHAKLDYRVDVHEIPITEGLKTIEDMV